MYQTLTVGPFSEWPTIRSERDENLLAVLSDNVSRPLRHVIGNPGLLDRMAAVGGKAFDGNDLLPDNR